MWDHTVARRNPGWGREYDPFWLACLSDKANGVEDNEDSVVVRYCALAFPFENYASCYLLIIYRIKIIVANGVSQLHHQLTRRCFEQIMLIS